MAHKLDIFKLLGSLNSNTSRDIFEDLSVEERRGFAPLVVMRWMSGTSDERQIMLLNEFANPNIFALAKHPQLLMQLLHASSTKSGRRNQWLGIKGVKKQGESLKVLCEYFDISVREAKLLIMPAIDELLEMAGELGWQPEDIKKLKTSHAA